MSHHPQARSELPTFFKVSSRIEHSLELLALFSLVEVAVLTHLFINGAASLSQLHTGRWLVNWLHKENTIHLISSLGMSLMVLSHF